MRTLFWVWVIILLCWWGIIGIRGYLSFLTESSHFKIVEKWMDKEKIDTLEKLAKTIQAWEYIAQDDVNISTDIKKVLMEGYPADCLVRSVIFYFGAKKLGYRAGVVVLKNTNIKYSFHAIGVAAKNKKLNLIDTIDLTDDWDFGEWNWEGTKYKLERVCWNVRRFF